MIATKVLVDGHDVKDLNVRWLRKQIGVVSQEPVLFDASIEENIRLGKVDATLGDIQAAAKMANAHDFIQLLPEGYKTNVGERGAQLSGGQKQRISIARALVRNPRILLMDEATSALDHESEAVVQAALEKARKGRTTITIAHRLSTVKHADKILAISEGEVAEEGTHDELIAQQGLYYQLVEIQTRIDKESDLEIEDVVIVEDDPESNGFQDNLWGASFKRTLSDGSQTETSLAVRHSHRISQSDSPVEDTKTAKPEDEPSEEKVRLMDIVRYNAPEWRLIVVGSLAAAVAGLIHPCFSFILSEFVKIMSIPDDGEQRRRVNILGVIILAVAAVVALSRILMEFCISKSGAYLTARLRKLTFESIVNQDMEYFDNPNNQVGAITSRLSGDAALVQGATGSKIGQLLEGMSTIVCALAIAFVFGWKLAFVVVSFMPLMIAAGLIQGKVMAGAALKEKSMLQQASRMCSETVDNIRTVAALGREDFFLKNFNTLVDLNERSNRKKAVIFGMAYSVANSMLFFAYAASFYYGGILIDDGEMEFYEVFRVFGAIIFGGIVIGRNSSFGVDYVKAKLAAGRIINLIDRKPKVNIRDHSGDKL
ncbi:Bile salt export pump, partial [Plakobranchus ocellatus]